MATIPVDIGTVQHLDGEMVVIDGGFFTVKADGSVSIHADDRAYLRNAPTRRRLRPGETPTGVTEMKPKTVVLLAIAVGGGLLAMLGVQQAMSGGQTQVEEKVNVLMVTLPTNFKVAKFDNEKGNVILFDREPSRFEIAQTGWISAAPARPSARTSKVCCPTVRSE
ncbi:MAG: hypothetical protein HC793_01755 [Aquincola sp.]|nr:hypothetical protein [Aquincola sp.]